MIFVSRTPFPAPDTLRRYQEHQLAALAPWFAVDIDARPQRGPDLAIPGEIHAEAVEPLRRMFHDKCAYCERPANTIDHFRPRQRAARADRHLDADHYWWLAWSWDNLYICCHACNSRKGKLFPIEGPAASPLSFGDALRAERPLLLDPCHDRPEEHVRFLGDGLIVPLTNRGAATIKILMLDAPDLVQARRRQADATKRTCELMWDDSRDPAAFAATMSDFLGPHTPYLAASRAAVEEFMRSRGAMPSAAPAPQTDIDMSEVEKLPTRVWLDEIEIVDFKTIGKLKLRFPEPGKDEHRTGQPWLMVLGENSVGKSSLLQAVALALTPDQELLQQEKADTWLNRHAAGKTGHVLLTFTDGTRRKLAFTKGEKHFAIEGRVPAGMPVLAYGSTRLLPRRSKRQLAAPAAVSVRNLFDHTHPLTDIEYYLCDAHQVGKDRFEYLASALVDLLPVDDDARLTRTKQGLRGKFEGKPMSLDELSDGYKSVLALAMDIMFHVSSSSFDMTTAHGLVMIDELELHLHPRWKIRIVDQLRKLFPHVRFIASTHDPLCVHGLYERELHVMAKHPEDKHVFAEQIDVPHGARADEVLTGPWFGLTSTLDAETLMLMSEHGALLRRPERNGVQQRRMEELDTILSRRMGMFGNTRAQRAAMAAAAVLEQARPQSQADQIIRHRLTEILARGPQGRPGARDA